MDFSGAENTLSFSRARKGRLYDSFERSSHPEPVQQPRFDLRLPADLHRVSFVKLKPDFPGKVDSMLKVKKFRRRKNGLSFFLPVIACLVLLLATVQRTENQDAVRQDASKPRILNGGGAWTGGSALKGSRKTEVTSAALPGAQLVDTVTRIRDGDTIVVGLIPIRIANLDCAERGSKSGDRATRQITGMVKNVQLRCTLEGRRSYDREVGVCSLPNGRDIGEILIAGGYCQRWRG